MSTIRFGRDARERDELLGRVADLPAGIAPSRDLWPGIRARIEVSAPTENPAPHGLSWRWALAAAVAVASVSVLFTWLAIRGPGATHGSVPVAATQPVPAAAVQPVSYENYARLGPHYAETRAQMLTLFRARLATLSPETRQRVEQDLATIQKAASDIDAALAKDPSSALLNNLLVSTYQDEMRLYTRVTAPI